MDRTPVIKTKNDSTRTSAGISRSLLTPCRRVGLTRNRKTRTPTTPQSPLILNDETTETPKAKRTKLCKNINSKIVSTIKSADDADTCKNSQDAEIISAIDTNESINFSPLSINVSTQLSQKIDDDSDSDIPLKLLLEKDKKTENSNLNNSSTIVENTEIRNEEISLPSRQEKKENVITLSKRCVSVIGKKIVKQPIVRLENFSHEYMDADFSEKVTTIKKSNSVKKLEKKVISTSKDKIKNTLKENSSWSIVKQNSIQSSPFTEDDDFDTKKTILVRKSYNKNVSCNKVNLIKSKSTGTITAKDIEEISLRIQKKQLALGQNEMFQSNEELEKLILKWRNGCQKALEHLLTLMKEKVPEKSNMEMEELLKMLNIPVNLVKYNTDEIGFD